MDNQNNIQPAQQMQPQQPQKPANSSTGNILCIISLICRFVVPAMMASLYSVTSKTGVEALSDFTHLLQSTVAMAAYIASWVLVIVARIKYKTTFSLVVLIIYLVILVLVIIGIVIFLAMCLSWSKSCQF